jgi:hypothetical protein
MQSWKKITLLVAVGALLSGCTSSTDFGYGVTGNVIPRFAFWDGILLEPEDQAFAVICQHARAFETGKLVDQDEIKRPTKAELNDNFRDVSINGLQLLSFKFPEMEAYKEGAIAKLADPSKNTDGWNQFDSACQPYNKMVDRTYFVTIGRREIAFPGCYGTEYQYGVRADLRAQKGDEWISIADGEFVEDEWCENDVYSENKPLRLKAKILEYDEIQTLRWYLTSTDGREFSGGGTEWVHEVSVGRNSEGYIGEVK